MHAAYIELAIRFEKIAKQYHCGRFGSFSSLFGGVMIILSSVAGHSAGSTSYACLASVSFFLSSFCFLFKAQIMQESPEIIMKTLQKHEGVNRPTLHPRQRTMTITIGKTTAKKNFLILLLHLNSTKQGRLKKEVHSFWHISADRLSIVSTIELTSSSTALTATLTALIVVSCSCWNYCSVSEMTVLAVDLMVSSALEMML